ncbi:MAG: response regulator transcription factor [Betaproteobacteria bacterium]|nr:response regulator transcription factor [Betaproteobacteria bacterium]
MTKPAVVSQRNAHRDREVLKILIADAHPRTRDGLASALEGLAPRVEIFHADSLQGVLARLAAHPDTALVLVGALNRALGGDVYALPDVLRTQLAVEFHESQEAEGPTPRAAAARDATEVELTKRQLEVLALLVQGKPNKVISRELGLAQGTVKVHTAAIFRALGVSNRTEAAFAVSSLGIQLPEITGSRRVEREISAPRQMLVPA